VVVVEVGDVLAQGVAESADTREASGDDCAEPEGVAPVLAGGV